MSISSKFLFNPGFQTNFSALILAAGALASVAFVAYFVACVALDGNHALEATAHASPRARHRCYWRSYRITDPISSLISRCSCAVAYLKHVESDGNEIKFIAYFVSVALNTQLGFGNGEWPAKH